MIPLCSFIKTEKGVEDIDIFTGAFHHTLILKNLFDSSTVLGNLSDCLMHLHKLKKLSVITDSILRLSIVIEDQDVNKFKPEDRNTSLERLVYFCKQMKIIEVPVMYQISTVHKIPFTPPEVYYSIWPFDKQWTGNGNYIMIAKQNSQKGLIDISNILKYAESKCLDVVEFDYTWDFEYLHDQIIHSQCVFSGRSGVPSLGIHSNVPTIFVGKNRWQVEVKPGVVRPVLYGSGNLGTTYNVNQIKDGDIIQDYFNGALHISESDCVESSLIALRGVYEK